MKASKVMTDDSSDGQADYSQIVAQAPVGFAQLDTDGRHVFANDRYCEILGRTHAEILGKTLHDFIHRMFPLDAASAADQSPICDGVLNGTFVHETDETFVRQDGTHIPVECWIQPITVNGQIHGTMCTLVQRTEQDLRNRELAHRVKNMFAIAQAVVGQTLRGISVPREIVHVINQRLAALSGANAVVMRARLGNSMIVDVVEAAVAAHRTNAYSIVASGPTLELGSRAALAITLALHELCTNAAKYGALSSDDGAVTVEWAISEDAAGKSFRMSWKEQGGPPVTPPARKGFGSRLIVDNISADLRGRGDLTFDSDGVRWNLEAPLAALTE